MIDGREEKRATLLDKEAKLGTSRENAEAELKNLRFPEIKAKALFGSKRGSSTISRIPASLAKLISLTKGGREAGAQKISDRVAKNQHRRVFAHILGRAITLKQIN